MVGARENRGAADNIVAARFGSYKALLLELDAQLQWSAHDQPWCQYRPRWLSNLQALSPNSPTASAALLLLDFEASLYAASQSTWWVRTKRPRWMRTLHGLSAETSEPVLANVPKLASLTLDMLMGIDDAAFKPVADGGWQHADREAWIRQMQSLTSFPQAGSISSSSNGTTPTAAPPPSPTVDSLPPPQAENATPWARIADRLTHGTAQQALHDEVPHNSLTSSNSHATYSSDARRTHGPSTVNEVERQLRTEMRNLRRQGQHASSRSSESEPQEQMMQLVSTSHMIQQQQQQRRQRAQPQREEQQPENDDQQENQLQNTAHDQASTESQQLAPMPQHHTTHRTCHGRVRQQHEYMPTCNDQASQVNSDPNSITIRTSSSESAEEVASLQTLQRQLDDVKARAESLESRVICQICCERSRNAVILPCLHFLYCEHCIDKTFAMSDVAKCPVCRVPVQGVLQVKFSS